MRYLLLVVSLFMSIGLFAQEDLIYDVKGKITNMDNGLSEGGVKVTLYRNGQLVSSTQTSSSGKYALKATGPRDGKYELIYSKPGMVPKKINFEIAGLNVEDLPAGNEVPFPALDLDLFAERPGIDFSFLDNEPMASFTWDTKKMALDYDRVASEKVKKKINDLLLNAEKDAAQKELNYQKAIKDADALAVAKEYEKAVSKYEEALTYKPKEAYPAAKINELEALIQAQKQAQLVEDQANSQYNNLITAANNLRDNGSLEAAVAKYKEALLKKNEQYPKDQIKDLEAKILATKKETENQAAYQEAITKGDMFLKQNSLKAAREKYELASQLKPTEEYPKKKLKEIDDKQKAQDEVEEKKRKYEEALAAADASFDAEDFKNAKLKYQEALGFEAASTYVKGRITLCDQKIAELTAEQEQAARITQLLADGNKAMTSKDYKVAKEKFLEVLGIDDENEEAKTKLAVAEQKLKELQEQSAQEQAFKELVDAGDAASTKSDYQTAIDKYEAALKVKQDNAVTAKLNDARAKLASANAAADKKANYDKAMQEATSLMNAEKWIEAKAKFQEASTIDPVQVEPKDKIKAIDKILADEKATADEKAKFDATIASANQLFDNAKWTDAKAKYMEALALRPADNYVKGRLSDIETKLAADEAAKKKQMEFDNLVKEARNFMTQKKWSDAKQKLESALKVDPNGQEAANLLDQVNAEIANAQSEAEKLATFKKLKSEGMSLADQKNYDDAKLKLKEALAIMDDQEIKDRLKKIDETLDAETKAKELNDRYDQLLNEASSFEGNDDYANAISKYKAALELKPNETLPKQKIAELETKMRLNADQAKIDQQYNDAMTKAGNLATQDELQKAIDEYRRASVLKPSEAEPKNKILELEGRIRQNADQAKIDAEYKTIMQRGDQLMAEEKYLDAIKEFNSALGLKPNEKEPVEKAAEAERLEREKSNDVDKEYEKILTVAKTKMDALEFERAIELLDRAKGLKPSDPRPQQMLDQIKLLKSSEQAYSALMKEADALAAGKKYSQAKGKYLEASSKKPNEQLPKDKADEMQRLIEAAASSAQTEQLYAEYMANGNKFQERQEFERALSEFQNALSTKLGDVPAQNKIDEIQQILDNLANSQASDIEKKNKFNKLIQEADKFFGTESYLEAKNKYEEALAIDQTSSYAKKQVDECIRLEREKSSVQEEREYRKIIDAADKRFDQSDYEKAKEYYNRAISLRNYDPYPKKRLAEIDGILNPTTVASVELEDLGDPFDNSIMDGQALLEKADAERKLLNSTKAKAGIDQIQTAEEEETRRKNLAHQENSSQIYEVQKSIGVDNEENDLGRQETVGALRESEFERQNAERDNQRYEYSENLLDQEFLYTVNEEVALDYGVRESVYSDNADLMENYNSSHSDRIRTEIATDKDRNIDTDQELTTVKLSVDQDTRDDYDERAEVRAQVDEVHTVAVDVQEEIRDEKYVSLLDNNDQVHRVALAYDQKTVEDATKANNNNEDLKIVKYDLATEEIQMTDANNSHLKTLDREIAVVKNNAAVDFAERDENRQESVEIIKEGNKQLADAHYNEYNDELVKYITNKDIIEEEVQVNNAISERAEVALDKKIAYVETMDKKANTDVEEDRLSDEQERLNARKSVEVIYSDAEDLANDEGEKLEENTNRISGMTRTIEADKTAQAKGEQNKHLDAAGIISDIDDKPDKKVKVANELGNEYPEGVSQENFTQKDENGLMTAIITRRIVVIDGHADVYVRTQTLHGITYTKNGNASLEHVWNKETQGPHLQRNY